MRVAIFTAGMNGIELYQIISNITIYSRNSSHMFFR